MLVSTILTMLNSVFAIVLCHNGVNLTLNCLASLKSQDFPDLRIIVVDNDSQDDTVTQVQHEYPDAILIQTKENLGYTGGNNIGIKAAIEHNANFIFLLNNDTILATNCVSELASTLMENPQASVVGPMIYTWESWDLISSAGGVIDWQYADATNLGAGDKDTGQFPAQKVDFLNGCGLMVRSTAVENAGLLDDRYFMYWDEIEWCQRIRKSGGELLFQPAARMQHRATIETSDLSPITLYYITRNRFLFFAQHAPSNLKIISIWHALYGCLKGIYLHRKVGRYKHASATLLAIWHALTQKWGRVESGHWQS